MSILLKYTQFWAVQAANYSEFPRYKMGSALFDRAGKLITVGWNKRKTHPEQKKYAVKLKQPERQYLHAEIDALVTRRYGLIPYVIVVVRLTKNGKLTMARPCPICMRAIKEAGIEEIIYSDNNGKMVKEYIFR